MMNRFLEAQTKAKRAWSELTANSEPVIYIGSGTCGMAAGAASVGQTVQETLDKHGLHARVLRVGCIGPCYLEPLMDVKLPGKPRISYSNMDSTKVRQVLEALLLKGGTVSERAFAHFGEEQDPFTAGIPRFQDTPVMRHQVRMVLRNCGHIDPEDIDHYLANDGYVGLANALAQSPETVIEMVKEAGLRGRGGAGFPTFRKWQICRGAPGDAKYVICNCSEGDPGAFMNRSLIEGDPHCVLEGLLIAGYAIGASQGYVYINSDYHLAIQRLRKAIAQMHEHGLLGENILGSGFSFEIKLKDGGGAFVCGEETALIASIEGRRGMPRFRPPFPAIAGLNGKPTIINNVETLGTLPNILRHGAAWYSSHGSTGNAGTKTFSLVGKVRRPGLIEVPLGTTLRQIIYDIGGGPWKPFKAVQTGGPSGGCLSEEFLDLPVEYEAMASAGSIMGSGGMIVVDEDTCAVDLARYFLGFTQAESCGKCVPCRVGTYQMGRILDDLACGRGKPEDISKLQNLAETVRRTSLCGLGQTAPNPVLTTLRHFRAEYLAHAKEKICPAAGCKELVEYHIDPGKCTGCQRCVKVCPTEAIRGARSETHVIDPNLCIRCKACFEVCRYDTLAGNAITYSSRRSQS